MEFFTLIEDAAVLLYSKGVYKQAKVYRRGKDLFAGHGSGFIKLGVRGMTTLPNVIWKEHNLPDKTWASTKLGWLEYTG